MGGQPGKVGAAMMLPHMGQPRPAIQPRPGYTDSPGFYSGPAQPLPGPEAGAHQRPFMPRPMPRSGGGKGGQPMPRPGMQPQPGMMPPADQPSPVMEQQPDVMPPAGQPSPVVGPDASRPRIMPATPVGGAAGGKGGQPQARPNPWSNRGGF